MTKIGSPGITSITLLSGILLSGAASSVILQSTDDLSSNAAELVDGVIQEITTYLQLDDIIGKYYTDNDTRSIEQLIILIKQPTRTALDISTLTIKVSNDNDILLLGYSGHAQAYDSSGIFENTIWAKTNFSFSLIIVSDKDNSTQQFSLMNGDIAFIVIRLPEQFHLEADDALSLSIIPERGIMRNIELVTPSIHQSNIINFGDL